MHTGLAAQLAQVLPAATPSMDLPLPSASDDNMLPPSSAHEQLFAEVIRRDEAFGPLLQKIKSAYDQAVTEKLADGILVFFLELCRNGRCRGEFLSTRGPSIT